MFLLLKYGKKSRLAFFLVFNFLKNAAYRYCICPLYRYKTVLYYGMELLMELLESKDKVVFFLANFCYQFVTYYLSFNQFNLKIFSFHELIEYILFKEIYKLNNKLR